MLPLDEKTKQALISSGHSLDEINQFYAENSPKDLFPSLEFEDGKIKLEKIDMSILAHYFIDRYIIRSVDGALHTYHGGVYQFLSEKDFGQLMIAETHNSTIRKRKEIYAYVEAMAPEKFSSPERYILFQNGVFDVKTGKFVDQSSDFVFCNLIPHNYVADAPKCDAVDRFILSLVCGDPEAAELLWEMIGYCFYRKNPMQEFIFLLGEGGNGKSTLLDFLAWLIGPENVSYVTLDDMRDRFNLILMKNKLLNIGDDADASYMESVECLKKIVSGEPFLAGAKYQDKTPMRFYGKVLFSGNSIPRMSDRSNGLLRRINVLPMLNRFTGADGAGRNINILAELKTEQAAEYCIRRGLEKLQQVLSRQAFTKPDLVKNATAEFAKENNPILEFIEEYKDIIPERTPQEIYRDSYSWFCSDAGCKPVGRNEFYRRMRAAGYDKRKVRIKDTVKWRFVNVNDAARGQESKNGMEQIELSSMNT